MSSLGFIVLVREHGSTAFTDWHAVEGRFDSYEAAEAFADAEVGADWFIAEVVTFPTHGATGLPVEDAEADDDEREADARDEAWDDIGSDSMDTI